MMNRNKGFSLLEILLAVVIFVVGMLALAHLQTNLTRSATDANTRTVAAGIAEEILEELRGFRRISTDPDGTVFAFADIDSAFIADTVSRGGNDYVVTADVKGYNFNVDRTAVTETDPAVAGTIYDFKKIELTVRWNNNQEFLIDEATTIANTDMDSGYIVLKDVIHSVPALADAVVAAEEEALGGPIVDYTPGLNPDIVAIQLSDSKFKESTTPKPDVIRRDEFVETWFDVITYNQTTGEDGLDSFFLRREEFLVVSCECELMSADANNKAFKPTTWNGAEYVEGAYVAKPYGVSASNSQSPYCDTCCRDHHDDPSSTSTDELYDPHGTWTSNGLGSNHDHYGRDNQGNLITTPVSVGEDYAEACRLVRKDGFMRVTQDFRQEHFIALPQSFLSDTNGVAAYSDYVTAAIDDFIDDLLAGDSTPTLTAPLDMNPPVRFPADASNNPMALPVVLPAASDSAQLVSRGIYIDHLTADTLELLDCLAPASLGGQGDSPENCGAEGITNYLEIFPFFDVQTTFLSGWDDDVNENPVSVTSERIADDNTHSRGMAKKETLVPADVTITSTIHRGNIGLAATDPIDPFHYDSVSGIGPGETSTELFISANGGGNPPSVPGITFAGTIGSGVMGVIASNVAFTGSTGITCSLNTTQFSCFIPDSITSIPYLTISGYSESGGIDLWVCESTGILPGVSDQGVPKTTVFDLSSLSTNWTVAHFSIQATSCP